MTDSDPRGPGDGREPIVSAEQLHTAIEALGIKTGGGPDMPRAQALGALLFLVEQLLMFDVDRIEAASVRSGYVNMALMAGMAMDGEEQLTAGAVVPAAEFTDENYESASFAFARLVEDRLSRTLLDLEEMSVPAEPGRFDIGWPIRSWLRAVVALMPHVNAGEADHAAILKSAKVAKKNAADARQHLADLIKLASKDGR
ncbi:hypothetical protein [Streptomyces albogriseolus]|uniref:hypothetical protein n=1 Tax=Streptomyces albogriseolus TaxID=1887 RepID=UPI003460A297